MGMDLDAAPLLPGWTVFAEAFADGPPRWYARRGRLVVAAPSAHEVLAKIWDEDASWAAASATTFVAPTRPFAAPAPPA